MELGQLEAFIQVASHRSFSKAAEVLFLTQPSVTARIQSLLRRSQAPPIPVPALQTYSHGGLTIHFPSRDVEVDGRSIPLTNTEYRLLYHLVRNAGRIVSHRDLLQTAWGSDNYGEDVVRVYVSRLRAKIEPNPAQPRYIVTKSGLGYLFAGEPDLTSISESRLSDDLEGEPAEDGASDGAAPGDEPIMLHRRQGTLALEGNPTSAALR